MKVRELLPFESNNIPSSIIGRVYSSYVRSILIYESETRPLQADVWLKIEGADMKIIIWNCVVSMTEGLVKN